MKTVVFRVDAALHIGSGHVMRCLTLADELTRRGVNCLFICRDFEGNFFSLIRGRGYLLYSLPIIRHLVQAHASQSNFHEHWLGVFFDEDAKQTIRILNKLNIDVEWLIVDHYAIDYRWETLVRPYVKNIMLIDDLADRKHNCDLLLDQNYYENFDKRYFQFCSSAITLLGPQYAVLRPEFSFFREQIIKAPLEETNIIALFIFFSGVDSSHETLKFIQGYLHCSRNDFFLHVVLGRSNIDQEEINDLCKDIPTIKLYNYIENVAQLMRECHYAFGASGSTNWERFCLGLNCSIVSIAENQVAVSCFLQKQGLIDYIGKSNTTTTLDYQNRLEMLDVFSKENEEKQKKIMSLVDGLGCQRVVNIMLGINHANT